MTLCRRLVLIPSQVLSLLSFSAQPEERGIPQLLLDTVTFYLLASNSINFYVLLLHCV